MKHNTKWISLKSELYICIFTAVGRFREGHPHSVTWNKKILMKCSLHRQEKKSTDNYICQKDQGGSRKYNEDENLHRDIQSRHRSKSPSRSDKHNRGRSSSRDRGSHYSKNKKGRHSKRQSRSKSCERKDGESSKSKHKHKKHKHKKVKSEKDVRDVNL